MVLLEVIAASAAALPHHAYSDEVCHVREHPFPNAVDYARAARRRAQEGPFPLLLVPMFLGGVDSTLFNSTAYHLPVLTG